VYVEPAVAEDTVFVGSCSGVYYALDAHTGAIRWSFDMSFDAAETTFHTNPVLVDDLVITASDGGSFGDIYAFDRKTGEIRWQHLPPHGQVAADLIHVKGLLLALTKNGHLVALDAKDGSERWTVGPAKEAAPEGGSVLADGNTIFLAGRDEHVYAIRPTDGSILWTRDLGSPVSTSLAKFDDHLYVGCDSNLLYRLDAENGEITGLFETEEDPGGKLLAFPDAVVFLGHEPSTLIAAVDANLTKILWTAEARDWTTVRPAVWSDLLLIGDKGGNLFALNPHDGTTAWTDLLSGQLRGIGVTEHTIFIGTIEGKLYAYQVADPESGVGESR